MLYLLKGDEGDIEAKPIAESDDGEAAYAYFRDIQK